MHRKAKDTYAELTPAQAADSAATLAKALYGAAFDELVRWLNSNLSASASDRRHGTGLIGVLDIFGEERRWNERVPGHRTLLMSPLAPCILAGFEIFAHNSFEQVRAAANADCDAPCACLISRYPPLPRALPLAPATAALHQLLQREAAAALQRACVQGGGAAVPG